MSTDEDNGWIEAAVLLSETPDAAVICPNCGECDLSVFDVSIEGDDSEFERVMYCPQCQQHTSIRMRGEEYYLELAGELTPVQRRIREEIRIAKRCSADRANSVNSSIEKLE